MPEPISFSTGPRITTRPRVMYSQAYLPADSATIVAESAGKYACEYMTRGRVVILGPVENEIGSGMTGGELFVYDPKNEVPAKLHSRSVAAIDTTYVDYEWMHPLIIAYHAR